MRNKCDIENQSNGFYIANIQLFNHLKFTLCHLTDQREEQLLSTQERR